MKIVIVSAVRGSTTNGSGEPGDERLALVNRYLRRVGNEQDQLIQVLHVAQEVYGHLPADLLRHVARALRLPESRVYGVATFYHLFSLDPPGDHSCTVCTGTACFVKGSDAIVAALRDDFGIEPGETTADRSFTLGTTRCLGSCGLAPVLVLDGEVHSHQDAESARAAARAAVVRERV